MFFLSRFSDNSGSDREEPKPSLGFRLSANLLSALEKTTFCFQEWAFSLQNAD